MESGTEEAGPAPPMQPRSSPAPAHSMDAPTQPHTETETEPAPATAPANATGAEAEAEAGAEAEHPSPASSSKSRPISAVVPPWWQRHERNISHASQSSLRNTITLEDHTADPDSETSRGLWARSVTIDDYCVVQGKTGVGSYVVWNCVIQTLDVGVSSAGCACILLCSS